MNFKELLIKSTFYKVCFLASGFVLNIALARLLGAAVFGALFYDVSIYAFFIVLLVMGIDAALPYHLLKRMINTRQAFVIAIAWILFAALVAVLILPHLNSAVLNNGLMGIRYLVYAFCFIAGNLFISFFQPLFFARGNFKTTNAIIVLANLLVVPVVYYLHRFPAGGRFIELSIAVYFCSYLAAGIDIAAIFFFRYVNKENLPFSGLYGVRHNIIRYALYALLSNGVAFLMYRIDLWFVERYCTATAMGNYAQVSRLVTLFLVFPKMASSAIFQAVADAGLERIQGNFFRVFRGIAFIIFTGCIILCAVGFWLFPAVYGPTFNAMYMPYLFYIPGIVALCLSVPLSACFSGAGRIAVNVGTNIICAIALTVGCIILVPGLGSIGAAMACSISYILLFLLQVYLFSQKHHFLWKEALCIKKSDFKYLKSVLLFKKTFNSQL